MSWPITLVFFMLIVMLKSWQAWEKQSIRLHNGCSVSGVIAATFAKSRS